MKPIMLLLALSFLVACSSKQDDQNTQQTGTASGTMAGEVIGADYGYIVENAGIATADDPVAFSIKGVVSLKKATSQVMIVRTQSTDGSATEMLVLEFPSFAEGTVMEFTAGGTNTAFWIFGLTPEKKEVMQKTGSVEGSLRLVKMAPAANSMGLNRDVQDGTGEMEIVVTGIENGGLKVPAEKKYAARYQLPIITLDELARINQPI